MATKGETTSQDVENTLPSTRDGRGRFVKGFTANPTGRPLKDREVAALAQRYAPEAIGRLVEILRDPKTEPGVVVRAAQIILERGYGRPPQAVDVTTTRIDIGQLHLQALQASNATWSRPASVLENDPDRDEED